MMTRSGQRMAIAAGALLLGSIILFCSVSIATLVLTVQTDQSNLSVLADPYIWHIARFTLFQAFLSTCLSLFGGIPVATALHRQSEFFGRKLIMRLMLVPMRMPTLVVAFGLIGIWGRNGFLNQGLLIIGFSEPISIYGLTGILIAHTFFNIPLTAQLLLQGLEKVPTEYWRLAANLNMGPVSTFRFIEWPVFRTLIPGIAGLIFILCATSFTLVLVLGGGPQATTLEVAIYQSLHFDFDPVRAVMLGFFQIALVGCVLGLMAFLPNVYEPGSTISARTRRFDGRSSFTQVLDYCVILSITLFLGLPLINILVSGLTAHFADLFSSLLFWRAVVTSLVLSVLSGVLAICLSAIILISDRAIGLIRRPQLIHRGFLLGLAGIPMIVLLVPPVVLATGWFLTLPDPTSTVIAGPILVLILNSLMALPFLLRILRPAYRTHIERTDRLSESLNIFGFNRFRLVDWPCLKLDIYKALSLAMALSMGDLGSVTLFGSDDFVTLPWLLYSKLGSYRSTDAAGLALIIAVICFLLAGFGYGKESRRAV